MEKVTATLVLDREMADRLRAHHSDMCKAVLDFLELALFTASEREQRDRARIGGGK